MTNDTNNYNNNEMIIKQKKITKHDKNKNKYK